MTALGSLALAPLTRDQAVEVCTWRYPPPYDCYDMTDADPDELADPASGFHALTADGRLVGFRSFGRDGRVPGWAYDDTALDTGGGLHPDLVGQGLGREAIRAGLTYGRSLLAPSAYRMTVAGFNERALRVVRSLGFERVGRFRAPTGVRYEVLVRPER
ncbi:hypothetical protein NOK12_36920 [Nocardioides sp. OK12]|uniref:GNAT family N-acetyltransferase n=1 Tax=Nocardioides sp. OK12 TaxID=2758661 RepID=UPI0021C34635|nr:GNAT family protein [Nocardioides sp. OK12]GHJ61174.1 hypothetical protein NOK12_36920 [Nocardioides sp. OK12]